MNDNTNLKKSKEESQDGLAKVQDRSIEVTDPKGSGNPAILVPQEGVELFINEGRIADKSLVSSQDNITISELTYTEPPQIFIDTDSDHMSAIIKIEPEKRVSFRLLDQPPQNVIYLKTEKEELFTDKYPSSEDIILELKKKEIVYGVDKVVLEQCTNGKITQGKIAVGKPPEEGSDGYLEFFFETDIQKITYDSDKGKVNYRERYHIPQVSEGDILAIIHPPVEGSPGKKITGEKIPPTAVKEVSVKCGDGATIKGNQIIATNSGRPLLKKGKEAFISVEPIYIHKGNVDMQSGNIRFQGHVKIEGEISEGMTIKSEGDLEVMNNAAGSNVIAGGNVSFSRNCINCHVKAGGLNLLCQDLNQSLSNLVVSVESTIKAVNQLIKALKERGEPAEKNFVLYTQTLLTTKFPEIPDTIQEIRNTLSKSEFSPPESVLNRLNEVDKFFLGEEWKKSKTASSFEQILSSIKEAFNILASFSTTSSNILSYYVQNSYLQCTGDIHVTGPGSYNSQFECEGKVSIVRLFRGGSIIAGDSVYLGEAGTPGSSLAQGVIQVPENKTVTIKKVYEGTRIKIGERIHRFDDIKYNVKAVMDRDEDRIKIIY